MTEANTAAPSTSNGLRPTTLLLAATLALAALAAQSMPHGAYRWVTASTVDGSVVYTAAASEAACRAAQADGSAACLNGGDMRQVSDEQALASR